MVEHYKKSNKIPFRISDLGESFGVMNLAKDDITDEGDPCILYGELFTTYGCVVYDVLSHTMSSNNATRSQEGDLLFPASTTVDAVSLISPSSVHQSGVILGGDMFGIHVNDNFNSAYLSYYFNIIGRKSLAKYAKGSTIIHLHYSDIKNHIVHIPSKADQDKLVTTLCAVEYKQLQYDRLLANYYSIKQFLLRQMFI